jgi:hypothetical protein
MNGLQPNTEDANKSHVEQIVETNSGFVSRLHRAIGPVVAGMIIDALDLLTFGPLGLVFGIPIGGLAGYWLGNCLKLSSQARIWCAIAAAIYCTIPFTEFIPLATLVGAYVRFSETDEK